MQVNAKEVTLYFDGRESTFSEAEIIDALECYFYELKKKRPEEGKWFEVNPLSIDQSLFEEEIDGYFEKKARKLILEAFEELRKNPERNKPFKILVPEKTWNGAKTPEELRKMSSEMGDRIADWVELALEWAQRIANGEPWKELCNMCSRYPVTYNACAVKWKNGHLQQFGGLCACEQENCAYYKKNPGADNVVPLVVSYK